MSEITLDDIARRIDNMRAEIAGLRQAMEAGDEMLREDVRRRFDASERKSFEQLSLLKAVIRTNLTNR